MVLLEAGVDPGDSLWRQNWRKLNLVLKSQVPLAKSQSTLPKASRQSGVPAVEEVATQVGVVIKVDVATLAEVATQVGVVIQQVEREEAFAGTRRADIGALRLVSVVLERCCCC